MKKTTPSQEDYLKTIYKIFQANGQVRSIDIANALGVSRASVNKALTTLMEKGFVIHEYYGDVEITKKGIEIARAIQNRFNILQSFLIGILKVPEDIANADACEMEHALSKETTCQLCNYIKKHHPNFNACIYNEQCPTSTQ